MLKQAYKRSIEFRNIYKNVLKQKVQSQFLEWKQMVNELKIEVFNTVTNSLDHHLSNILIKYHEK